MGRAFSPPIPRLVSETQGVALGWYNGAPLALSFVGVIGTFPAMIAARLGIKPIRAIVLTRNRADLCDCPGSKSSRFLRSPCPFDLTFVAGGRILEGMSILSQCVAVALIMCMYVHVPGPRACGFETASAISAFQFQPERPGSLMRIRAAVFLE